MAGLTVDLTISAQLPGDNRCALRPKRILLMPPEELLLGQGCTFATMSWASFSLPRRQACQRRAMEGGMGLMAYPFHLSSLHHTTSTVIGLRHRWLCDKPWPKLVFRRATCRKRLTRIYQMKMTSMWLNYLTVVLKRKKRRSTQRLYGGRWILRRAREKIPEIGGWLCSLSQKVQTRYSLDKNVQG